MFLDVVRLVVFSFLLAQYTDDRLLRRGAVEVEMLSDDAERPGQPAPARFEPPRIWIFQIGHLDQIVQQFLG